MLCPSCSRPVEVSDDKSRAYCHNKHCQAMIVLIPTISVMQHTTEDRST